MTTDGSAERSSAASKRSTKSRRTAPAKIPDDVYEAEIFRLQTEFVKLQEWVKASGARIVVVVESDIKKHARLNMMAHLLSTIGYQDVPRPKVKLPSHREISGNYQRPPRELSTYLTDHVATLAAHREKAG